MHIPRHAMKPNSPLKAVLTQNQISGQCLKHNSGVWLHSFSILNLKKKFFKKNSHDVSKPLQTPFNTISRTRKQVSHKWDLFYIARGFLFFKHSCKCARDNRSFDYVVLGKDGLCHVKSMCTVRYT